MRSFEIQFVKFFYGFGATFPYFIDGRRIWNFVEKSSEKMNNWFGSFLQTCLIKFKKLRRPKNSLLWILCIFVYMQMKDSLLARRISHSAHMLAPSVVSPEIDLDRCRGPSNFSLTAKTSSSFSLFLASSHRIFQAIAQKSAWYTMTTWCATPFFINFEWTRKRLERLNFRVA